MTERQEIILLAIVEEYIETGTPVGSKFLLSKLPITVSSATIRNEMVKLEELGYLDKTHTSSGRVPSTKGFKYYATNSEKNSNKDIEKKLNEIFARRSVSIDITLDEAARSISEMAGLTLVTSSSETDELLKSIQLTPLNENAATIVLVTSAGRVESKLIEYNNFVNNNDVRIAIRLFKDRLINTKLKDIPAKVDALAPILANSVKNYEELVQMFIHNVFNHHNIIKNKVYGNSNIIKQRDISRDDLAKLMNLISNKSIWETIEGELDEDETLKIDVRDNNTSLISKKVETKEGSKEISIVGSNRLHYEDAKGIIHLLEKFLKGEI